MIRFVLTTTLTFIIYTCFPSEDGKLNLQFHGSSSLEGIYVHTNKDVYFAGDIVLYNLYRINLNRQDVHWRSKVVYLTITNPKGEFISKNQILLKNQSLDGFIHIPDTLSSGIYKVTCWTNIMLINQQPLFSKQIVILNRFDENPLDKIQFFSLNDSSYSNYQATLNNNNDSLTGKIISKKSIVDSSLFQVTTDKKTYKTREKVTLTLSNHFLVEDIIAASVSVVREEALAQNQTKLAHYYNQLQSEQHAMQGVDYIGYNYSNIQKTDLDKVIPENFGSIISGKVIDKLTGKIVPNITVLLSTPDTLANLKYFETTADGSFFFLIDEYYQGRNLYLSFFNPHGNIASLEIQLNKKFFSETFSPEAIMVSPNIEEFVKSGIIIKRTNKAYNIEVIKKSNGGNHNTFNCKSIIYKKPIRRIITSDFVPLVDFQEVANEIIPVLKINGQKENYTARMVSDRTRTLLGNSPQFILNGILFPSVNELLKIPFREIDYIDIINLPWAYGKLEFNGIISIVTKNRNYALGNTESYHTIVSGIPVKDEFETIFPSYEVTDKSKSIPDFRELLYWNADISVTHGNSNELSFYTSDLQGSYTIVFEGLTKSGMPVSISTKINVTN